MNKLLPVVLVLAAVGTAFVIYRSKAPSYVPPVVAAQETIPLRLASQPFGDEVVRVLDVEGMCCGGCRPKIYAALVEVPGVREAAVEIGVATAIVRKDVAVAALEQALTFDDYVAHARP